MPKFTFQRVTLNGRSGWIATRRDAGLFIGRAFGRTRFEAVASLM